MRLSSHWHNGFDLEIVRLRRKADAISDGLRILGGGRAGRGHKSKDEEDDPAPSCLHTAAVVARHAMLIANFMLIRQPV